MKTEQAIPLEEKQIPGISFKLLLSLIVATASICGTTISTYFALNNKIDQLQLQKVSDDKYNDLRLKTLELSISAVQAQVNSIQEDINNSKKGMN